MGCSRLLEVVWAEDGGLEEKGRIKVTVLKLQLRMISNALENGQNDPVDLAGLADLAGMLADRMTDLAVFLDGLEVAQPPATGQADRAEMGKIING